MLNIGVSPFLPRNTSIDTAPLRKGKVPLVRFFLLRSLRSRGEIFRAHTQRNGFTGVGHRHTGVNMLLLLTVAAAKYLMGSGRE